MVVTSVFGVTRRYAPCVRCTFDAYSTRHLLLAFGGLGGFEEAWGGLGHMTSSEISSSDTYRSLIDPVRAAKLGAGHC